ncbi:MAG: VWA domain-containing protein [Thaumarchaeota archaeon]|nr:VWA domain-containing protein [Nitrososphaerota archaeon]
MSFLDFAVTRHRKISGKAGRVENVVTTAKHEYPVLGKDDSGPILLLPEPRIMDNGLWSFEGMSFRNDELGRDNICRLFLASVDHLTLHSVLSEYASYSEWQKQKDFHLAAFTLGLVEDALIEKAAIRIRPEVLELQAYASALSALGMKKPAHFATEAAKAQSAILLWLAVGRPDGQVSKDILRSVEKIARRLRKFKSNIRGDAWLLGGKEAQTSVGKSKLKLANYIYAELEKYGKPLETAALPYCDHHGECNILSGVPIRVSREDFNSLFHQARQALGISSRNESASVSANETRTAANKLFSTLERQKTFQTEAVERYASLLRGRHFHSVAFPQQDYREYLRLRGLIAGPMRTMADQLRMWKNEMDEDFKALAGIVDLQEAIQVTASMSHRTDVFTKDEPLKKNESWSILVDTSTSVSTMISDARKYATCFAEVAAVALAEVTSTLCANSAPWGMYGFGDKFYIVKDPAEAYSNNVKGRIGGLRPAGLTYLPDAIEIAASMQKLHLCEKNFMLVLSDGLPSGYPNVEEDLHETLRNAQREGIVVLAIGPNGDQIRKFFKYSCVVTNPSDLMRSFLRAYGELAQ